MWPETHQQFCQNKQATARACAAQAVCLGLVKDCARLGGQEVRGCTGEGHGEGGGSMGERGDIPAGDQDAQEMTGSRPGTGRGHRLPAPQGREGLLSPRHQAPLCGGHL